MASEEAILLAPGFFGFGTLGLPPDQIDYFDEVAKVLVRVTGVERIEVYEPPPAGPLSARVGGLYRRVIGMLRDGPDGGAPVKRLHLVGHSTGGVDIRLLVNEKYLWPGGPTGSERTAFLSRIGSLVSLSAPHHGTPIATRLRGAFELAIVPITLLSILAKRGALNANDAGAVALQILEQIASREAISDGALRLLEGLAPETAKDVERFLNRVIEDRVLIHELTPSSMARLNDAIGGGARAPLHDFVSVAPPPTTLEFLRPGFDWAQRAIYAAGYLATSPGHDAGRPFPGGPFLSDGAALASVVASDGIVPCASQVFEGAAAGIVLGDHLDVVGHFDADSWRGATVFKSDSRFDKGRFFELWSAIGKRIVEPSLR